MLEEVCCSSCLTRLYNTNSTLPDAVFLRAGTLDGSADLRPMAHIWVSRKQDWIQVSADIPTFEMSPSPEEFAAAVASAEQRKR